MRRSCTTSLSVLLMLNTACSDTSPADAAPALTEGGRAAITTSQIDALPEIDTQQDVRIDGHEAVLTSVEWIGILPDGGQAVLQPGDFRIRFFDATGADAGSFGRRGQGPGEFERPLRAGHVGEQIWVQDPVTDRITFVADGQLARTEPNPSRIVPATPGSADTTVYSAGFPLAVYPGDTLLLHAFHRGNDAAELLRTTLDGSIVGSVTTLGALAPPSVTVRIDGGALYLRPPFAPRPLMHVASDGRAIALIDTDNDNATWSLTVLDPHGDTLFVRDVSFRGEPIPGDSMDPALERQLDRVPTPAQRLAARRDLEPLLPRFFAPVQQLVVDDLGRTWVGLRPVQDARPWLVFSPGGRPLGVVRLPAAGRVRATDAESVYVVEPDEFDVQSVVRYRVAIPG